MTNLPPVPAPASLPLDVLIFGGGIAGLWLLDELHRRGVRVLLAECRALGAGQTIASQGIIHGGLKYMLDGAVSASARAIGDMPDHWRACLAGLARPDLRATRVRSACCYLWRTESFTSRAALTAARFVLRTPAERVPRADRPAALGGCPGEVIRVAEPVLDVAALLADLGRQHESRLLLVDDQSVAFDRAADGGIHAVHFRQPDSDKHMTLRALFVVFTAGAGNEWLRRRAGLPEDAMRRRPLHIVLARGALPELFGHCVDGNRTRVTITSAPDAAGRTIWTIGGELSERGVDRSADELIAHARREIEAVLPGIDLSRTEWASYRIDRAEGRCADGARPEGPTWRRENNVVTAWPTKLALAPRLAHEVADALGFLSPHGAAGLSPRGCSDADAARDSIAPDWPRPAVAPPPWEVTDQWHA